MPLERSRLCLRCLKPSGGVAPVPPVPSPGCRCCGCLWLLPVPLGSVGGVEAVREGETRACFASLEGGCRCRAVPTCVGGIGLAGACLRACHPLWGGVCQVCRAVAAWSGPAGRVRGLGRAVANGIGNAPSLPWPWPRMLKVPFLYLYRRPPPRPDCVASGGAPSVCLLPARRGGGSWSGGVAHLR